MHAAMMGDMSRSTSPADHARFDGKRPVADAPGRGYAFLKLAKAKAWVLSSYAIAGGVLWLLFRW
jgi:hypothetical protein